MEIHLSYLIDGKFHAVACLEKWQAVVAWTADPAECTCEACLDTAAELIAGLKQAGRWAIREAPKKTPDGEPNQFFPGEVERLRVIPHIPHSGEGWIDLDATKFTTEERARVEELLIEWFEDVVVPMNRVYAEMLRSFRESRLTKEEWFGISNMLEAHEEWELQQKLDLARATMVS
jgi:hypothetical protein